MKTSCFAYMDDGGCGIMTIPACDKCGFFKTKAQFDSDLEDSWRLIAKLDVKTQAAISKKYYNNAKPWRKYISK